MGVMDYIFGKQKTPQQQIREAQRLLNRSMREIDREISRIDASQKQTESQIRQYATKGNTAACRVSAKDLVRLRRHRHQLYSLRTQLYGLNLRITTLSTNHQLAVSMQGATKAIKSMNSKVQLPKMQQLLVEFEKQSEVMNMKQEMVADGLDDAFEELSDDEEQEDEIVQQILDEIGIQASMKLNSVPGSSLNEAVNQSSNSQSAMKSELLLDGTGNAGGHNRSLDDELQSRLDNLKK
ncbi:hypothetical protein BB560_004883 [Smittium megazygosporum]|uniref:Uncharacterized protein n=1 Tax=Smittium megazygosporum TaxID=133381 RepID=A0A2T9Z845_9FUNG|nr:hypothetical protein BB560_004883 [Smittium megazygosporum]